MEKLAIFKRGCISCGGPITSDRLSLGWVCEKCAKDVRELPFPENIFELHALLGGRGEIGKFYRIYRELADFEEFFKAQLGSKPWAAQLAWAKRVFANECFSINAPTGMGKTAFGLVMARYLARKGKRVYLLFPTTALVLQAKEKLPEALAYTGKKKKEFEKRLKSGDWQILITTNQFLARRFEDLKAFTFDFIFADDVDSLVKASKNIDRILVLLGFSEEDIALARERGEVPERVKRKRKGVLVVSTATGRARAKARVFQVLLDFGVGGRGEGIRNVFDFVGSGSWKEIVKRLGSGGLIFVPVDKGTEEAERVADELSELGFRAEAVTSGKAEAIERFAKGELDLLVGVAVHYGLLVRGIDLPERVKYALFLGVPRFKFSVSELTSISRLRFILRILAEVDKEAEEKYRSFMRWLRKLKPETVEYLNRILEEGKATGVLAEFLDYAENKVYELKEKLKTYAFADFDFSNGSITAYIPDVATYIQASGRTSRLFAGGITTGVSIVFEEREKLLKGIERAMRARFPDFEFKTLDELPEVWKKVLEDRELVKRRKKGAIVKDPVEPVLFIVESPNKARTIARFFGIPSKRVRKGIVAYEVFTGKYMLSIAATLGHVFDLIEDEALWGLEVNELLPIYDTIKLAHGIQFVSPRLYEPEKDKLDIIKALRELAGEYKKVVIATDPDEEGEKIGWDVAINLKPAARQIIRAEFHEVTPKAILRALEEPRELDINWVKAQIVRRIEDRLLGFALSKKVSEAFKRKGLSAGRVQTPVLGWIIERYRKRKEDLHYFFSVSTDVGRFYFDLPVKKAREAREIAEKIREVVISIVGEEVRDLNPAPPFDTQTMLLEASRLGFSASKTMQLAQDLFEAGLITYHRTDSTRVSDFGLRVAKDYLGELFYPRRWGTGGAHECIRPTRPIEPRDVELEGITWEHLRLYSLIFNRFMASQAKPAKVKVIKFTWEIPGIYKGEDEAIVEVLEEGWLKFGRIDLRNILAGKYEVKNIRFWLDSKFELFTQGTVIAEMRKRGIGRPSTYATIIQKLLDRRYIIETKRGFLIPTKLGELVYEYLKANYPELVSEERTRELHEKQDLVRDGKKDHRELIRELLEELKKYKLIPELS